MSSPATSEWASERPSQQSVEHAFSFPEGSVASVIVLPDELSSAPTAIEPRPPPNTIEHPALAPRHYPAGSYNPAAQVNPAINRGAFVHGDRPTAGDNIENRFELFLLGEGEKKVTEAPDTRITSSSIFTFNKEDHTLGNLLRSRLLQSPRVTFAGYKVPHPLFSQFELRVQTDGSQTPRTALVQACRELVNDLGVLGREFTKEWELRKMVGEGANGVGGDR